MILIYVPHKNPRIEYVVKHIFSDMAEITNNKDYYLNSDKKKINYSHSKIDPQEFFIQPACNLLFENSIKEQEVKCGLYKNTTILFPTSLSSDFSFDIFASVFFILSRYEEYLPFVKDMHGRFKPESSLAFQKKILHLPIVDIWILHFSEKLTEKFGFKVINDSEFTYLPTIDVDIAFAYKSKGIYRSIFGYLRSLSQLNFNDFISRAAITSGIKHDPYDSFDYILETHARYNLPTIFFIHVGDYSYFDKNATFKDTKFRELVRHLADYAEIGIHPSYVSADKPEKLSIEIERLSDIIRKDISKSRQHFLRLNLPQTYRHLCMNDIKEDFTMGYASNTGFRAGTCKPFYFFDLDKNESSCLKINPLSVMEGTLNDYLKKTPEEASEIINKQIEHVKNVNGLFVSLFHNESLSETNQWIGWRNVYENMIKTICEK
ncbi:MAG: polysaccharide deacetylase family protein [Bacteroidales bacterium]|nr:polysaccharide deacetylase family protein [Bacteroidales bacterium]